VRVERSRNEIVITVRNVAQQKDTVDSARLVASNSSLSRSVFSTVNHFACSPLLYHSFILTLPIQSDTTNLKF